MTTLHEQARAEAEKRWPVGMYHVWDGNLPISSEMFGGIARDSFKDGFLAGHEAATRARVVTTVTELDALPIGSIVRLGSGQVFTRVDDGMKYDWQGVGDRSVWTSSGVLCEHPDAPARVLYEPEEGR